ncbi:LOW QUALITY PROTEIN: A-kinase anchor protein 3 [Spheniscus humboldti]
MERAFVPRDKERCQDPSKEAEESDSQKDTERQKPENDMSSATLMLIQKLINKNRRDFFVCKVEGQPGNPIVDETNQNTGKTTKGHIGLSDTEQSCEEAVSGLTKMLTDQLNLSREDSSSAQFIGSLVDTVLKLCLMIVKYSNPESLLAEPGSSDDGTGSVGSKGMGTANSVAGSSKADSSSSPLVVLPFGSLLQNPAMENLQKLSSVAVEKGYKVGDVLQAMLKYKERHSGEAVGNSVQLPVLNWLLNNS